MSSSKRNIKLNRLGVFAIFLIITGLSATLVSAAPYFIYGKVYNANGTSGTADTENSYASMAAYRISITAQVGKQNSGPNPTFPEKIYPAYYNNVTTPAYFYSDVGSSDWITSAAEGQTIITVADVVNGRFGWTGANYTAARRKIISAADITGSESFMPDATLQQVPQPAASSVSYYGVSLTWTGLSNDTDGLVTGYTVYRSLSAGSGYSALSYTASQVSGGTVTFTDASLNTGTTYYYKIATNYGWGGGSNTVTAYVSEAFSNTISVTTLSANTADLRCSFSLPAANITRSTGQVITLVMQVNNFSSSETINNIIPSPVGVSGAVSAVSLLSGPTPSSWSIDAGLSEYFTWTYSATSSGVLRFTASVTGSDGSGTFYISNTP
ncbi:MAG TPA: hypothetical protein P5511_04340, partial [Candidatus Goldiibacteriota bacterium]|nr:hypothetical protein [Candidatus Goldiibacteriota bacterium]